MRALVWLFGFGALGLLAGCKEKGEDTGGGDADDTAAADTAETDDTGDTTDTGDTSETGETDDTAEPPLINTGYWGATVMVTVLNNGGTGTVVLYDPATGDTAPVDGLTVASSSKIACAGPSVFVLESNADAETNDRAIRIDAESGTFMEWQTGPSYGPRAVAWVAGQYWFANYNRPRVVIRDETGAEVGEVVLSEDADSDGSPEATGIRESAGKVLVSLARLTLPEGTRNGARLVAISPSTLTVESRVDMTGDNPSGQLAATPMEVYIHHAPTTAGAADGGVERVERTGFTSEGLVVDDATTSRIQQAAWLDPGGEGVWMAYTEGEEQLVGKWTLLDGAQMSSWANEALVVGLGAYGGGIWLAEVAADNTTTLRKRNPGDGAVTTEVSLGAGRAQAFAVCQKGIAPGGGDSGGGEADPPE